MEKITEIINEYGPEPIKLWVGPYFAVVIIKPEDIQVTIKIQYYTSKIRIKSIIFPFSSIIYKDNTN